MITLIQVKDHLCLERGISYCMSSATLMHLQLEKNHIDTIKRRRESCPVPSYQDPKFNMNNKPMGYFTYIYWLYSGVLSMLHSAPLCSWLHMHSLYQCHTHWGMPIHTSPWRGMTSTDIQIFISSIPSLGKGPEGRTIAVKGMKNWFLFIRLLRKIPKTTADVSGYNSVTL